MLAAMRALSSGLGLFADSPRQNAARKDASTKGQTCRPPRRWRRSRKSSPKSCARRGSKAKLADRIVVGQVANHRSVQRSTLRRSRSSLAAASGSMPEPRTINVSTRCRASMCPIITLRAAGSVSSPPRRRSWAQSTAVHTRVSTSP